MDTKKLRQKILDLAIRGKLVPQDPNDEPASVLLERIRAEKEQLIKEGKIKRSKKSAATDKSHYENVPFEIPENWCWVTGNDIFNAMISCKPQGDEFKYIDIDSIDNKNHRIISPKILKVKNAPSRASRYTQPGDVLFSMVRPYLKNIALVEEGSCIASTGFFVCSPMQLLTSEYCYYMMLSDYVIYGLNQYMKGDNSPSINNGHITSWLYPIPPINEQLRISAEIKKWFVFIDDLERGKIELESLIKQVKSTILDLAISGKLVPQDPNDEPAIELLKRINPGFKPCDNSHYENLPKGWAVCHLEDVCQICDNQRQPINSTERQERKKRAQTLYPYYGATGQVDWIDDYILDGTFILLGEDGAPFLDKFADKAYVVSGKIWVNNHAHILKPNCDITYLTYYLNRYDYSECVNGSTRLKLTQADMKNMTIVLPPLAEQHRIAGRIDKIFRMLDAITAEL